MAEIEEKCGSRFRINGSGNNTSSCACMASGFDAPESYREGHACLYALTKVASNITVLPLISPPFSNSLSSLFMIL